ncbi:hypothetical protein [Streptomyces sp. NPDC059802]|uniref:hypothetical protein n=1 Tax=Streptomyces sp. NPDC059802 TaxID=3346952 RepID=UPI003669FE4C
MAQCTVERLMRELGITGAVRGRKMITTIPDGSAERGPDPLDRRFVASAPNRCRVAGFTYVKTWSTIVHVAFVVGTFSPRITGWSASHSKGAQLVLDALEMGLWPSVTTFPFSCYPAENPDRARAFPAPAATPRSPSPR